MARWIALADPEARDPAIVGVKAARLARASAAGFPVLPGWVLPAAASAPAMSAARDVLRNSGPSAAYLAAIAAGDDPGVPPGVHEGPWVVRSSTPLDDDGRWSGAFGSYVDVSPGELPAAIRGCWGSAVGRGSLARCEESRVDVGSILVGVLVQPFVRFDAGGTARVEPDGTVVVSRSGRGPAAVVTGGEGEEVVVGADGRVDGPIPAATAGEAVQAAAALTRAAAASTGAHSIEWGAVAGDVVLLQLGPRRRSIRTERPRSSRPVPEGAERLARLLVAFPGPLGLELVLPWAWGAPDLPRPIPPSKADGDALREARSLSTRLASAVWGVAPSTAVERAREVSHLLRAGRLAAALAIVERLTAPDPLEAGRVLGAIMTIGDGLVGDGRLPAPELVWRLTPAELQAAIDGARAPVRRGPDRGEPFVAEVVLARGVSVRGRAVHGGVGAGPAHVVGGLAGALRSPPRAVLVASRPLPHLAPLLWHAAGLVTIGGSTGAHLFEVARSLGVPAVTGADLGDLGSGTLVAVDGDRGSVSILRPPLAAPSADARLVGSRSG